MTGAFFREDRMSDLDITLRSMTMERFKRFHESCS